MGVEPTAARSARPATSFEDWGAHRDTTTPTIDYSGSRVGGQGSAEVHGCRSAELLA